MRVALTPEARQQAADAAVWYHGRDARTVRRFHDRLRKAMRELQTFPELGAAIEGTPFRHLPLRPFPYLVIYEVRPDAVRILAIPHARQAPGSWFND